VIRCYLALHFEFVLPFALHRQIERLSRLQSHKLSVLCPHRRLLHCELSSERLWFPHLLYQNNRHDRTVLKTWPSFQQNQDLPLLSQVVARFLMALSVMVEWGNPQVELVETEALTYLNEGRGAPWD
jgi:hypothetical protein